MTILSDKRSKNSDRRGEGRDEHLDGRKPTSSSMYRNSLLVRTWHHHVSKLANKRRIFILIFV
jgi:hypothetical protein